MTQHLLKLLIQYIKNILILTALIGILTWAVYFFFPSFLSPILPWFIPYFLIISLIFHYYLLKSATKDVRKFIPRYMGSTGIKLMIYLGTLTAVAITTKHDPVPFVIGFFILYLLYTSFEVITFLKQSKQIQN